VSEGPDEADLAAAAPVEIWQERPDRRGADPVATALDLAAVQRDWPFRPGRFWFVTGQRIELYEVGAGDRKVAGE
jgi:hypothetical protein